MNIIPVSKNFFKTISMLLTGSLLYAVSASLLSAGSNVPGSGDGATSSPLPTASLTISDIIAPTPRRFSSWFCYSDSEPIPGYRNECCSDEMERFSERWYSGGYYLTTLLERLQRWRCDEFIEECLRPTFNYAEVTNLVYSLFCNRTRMESACSPILRKTVKSYEFQIADGTNNTTISYNWQSLADALVPQHMKLGDLTNPCLEIALFDRSTGGVGRFHEIVEPYFPFCGLQWSGYDIKTAMQQDISVWTALSAGCKASVIFFMSSMVLGGLASVAANITILVVFKAREKLRNSQALYQMSLAVADLMVGLIVWPNMVVIQVIMFLRPHKMGELVTTERLTKGNMIAYSPNRDNGLEKRFPGGLFGTMLDAKYINYYGFFTMMGITVSILTLMSASFNRFLAVSFPFRYRKVSAKRNAVLVCAVIWLVSIGLCLLPALITDIQYNVISSILISPHGLFGTILILIALIKPLIITWIVSITTFEISRRHAKRSTVQRQAAKTERRLAKTLSLMVGVFSICISLVYILIVVLTANSLWNFFIYSLRNKAFREASKEIYRTLFNKLKFKGITCRGRKFAARDLTSQV